MENKLGEIAEQFKDYRVTPQRRMIAQIFLENKDRHLSAEEVYQLIREKEKEIGLATIYRTLDLMEELGLLHKHHFGDGRSRYEINNWQKEQHHHHHLICRNCGKIFEVKEDLLHHLEDLITREHRFTITDHRLQFYGYCFRCSESEEEK